MQGKQLRVLLVEDNPGDARLVQEMLSEAEGNRFSIQHADSLLTALDALSHREFDVALLDLSLPDCQGMQTFTSIQMHAPGLPIVVLTGLESESMALDAVRSGVQDYLIKGTLATDSLVRALEYAIVREKKSAEQSGGEPKTTILGFLSSKGGVGTTTFACHFTRELRRQTDQKVLLVDLDVCSGTTGFLLRVQPASTILDAATNLHRLDIQFWKGLVCTATNGIDFMQAPGAVHFGDQLSGERVRHVLRFARSLYEWIVVDMGRLDVVSMSLLTEMKDLFVVSTDELPALYEAKRVIKQLLEKGSTREQVRLVLNRASRATMGTLNEFEKALGYPIYGVLSESHELNDAYADGRMLDADLDMSKATAKLVSQFLGAPAKVSAPTGFSLFGLSARLARIGRRDGTVIPTRLSVKR
jgi:Flp pilus assembly CpaE family ATPase